MALPKKVASAGDAYASIVKAKLAAPKIKRGETRKAEGA